MKLRILSLALLFPFACGDGRTDVINGGVDADPNAPDADLTRPDADPAAPDADPNAPDFSGPSIVIVNPMAGSIVGSFINIEADITDVSGVGSPVTATWGIGNTSLVEVELLYQTGARYSALYATADLRTSVETLFMNSDPLPSLVNPSLTVRASDALGNESAVGVQVVMDYTPPVLSLDPPSVRERALNVGVFECSLAFDPLGDDAVNDLETYFQLSEIRARVQDFGNLGSFTSEIVTFKAGIDPSTIQLFVMGSSASTTEALVVDLDDDGKCDDINPAYLQPNNEVVVINLGGIAGAGSSHFIADDPGLTPGAAIVGWTGCSVPADTPVLPDPVCQFTSLLTRIIADPIDPEPIIYGIPPFSDLVCLGPPFDSVANGIPDGWACMAVRGVDYLGNIGVSAPIRVCLDWDENQSDDCILAPGNQYPAPAFDCLGTADQNGVIDPSMPCQPRDFPMNGYIKLP